LTFPVPNTLGVQAQATIGGVIRSVDQLSRLRLQALENDLPFIVIGDGSNIVPANQTRACIGVMRIPGIYTRKASGDAVLVEVAAGESWHALVLFCLARGLHGLENLALIPGRVGAAPIQNIGAYGVELADYVQAVDVIDGQGSHHRLTRDECEFSYRDSVFKRRTELVVTHLHLELCTEFRPVLDYPGVRSALEQLGVAQFKAADLVNAVMAIRREKLPDPLQEPNAGSFFVNPIVSVETANQLRSQLGDLQTYAYGGQVKLSAAELIDKAGWKSRGSKKVSCWPQQPLVIVNRGETEAEKILQFAYEIQEDIRRQFQVSLELEPSVLS